MKNGYKIFDCNRHVIEPVDLWSSRLEEPLRRQVNMQVAANRVDVSVLDRPASRPLIDFLGNAGYRQRFAAAVAADFNAQSNLHDMDVEGIDAALLFPTSGMYATWANHVDGETSLALCRAYNDWLAQYCQTDSARLKGVALLPLQDVGAAARELRRAVEEKGLASFLMRPNPLLNRYLHDRVYDPIYKEAESLQVPAVMMEMPGSVLPTMAVERLSHSLFEQQAAIEPFELMLGFLSWFGGNVAERYPNLKFGFVGAGCGWLPYWLERHEEHWGGLPFGRDCPSPMPADFLFPKQGFIAADPWETSAYDVVEDIGKQGVVWGSHYPLPDLINFPNEADRIVMDPLLDDEQKRAVLWDNAASLFSSK